MKPFKCSTAWISKDSSKPKSPVKEHLAFPLAKGWRGYLYSQTFPGNGVTSPGQHDTRACYSL